MRTVRRRAAVGLVLGVTFAMSQSVRAACVGDCDGHNSVTVNEIIVMVDVALGQDLLSACPAADADNSGTVTVDELIQAVNNTLYGCGPPVFYRAPAVSEPSGPRADGSGVLPNGRLVTPTGSQQVTVETLPLNLRVGATGHLFVTNDGYGNDDAQRYLQVIDPLTLQVQRTASTHFFGLAVSPDGHTVYVANAPNDRVDVFSFEGNILTPLPGAAISFPAKTFPMGLDCSPDGTTLYVAGLLSNTFWRVDLGSKSVQQATAKIGDYPYAVVVGRDGQHAYVSSWGINNGNDPSAANIMPVPLPPNDPNASARSSVAVLDIGTGGAPTLSKYVPIGRGEKVDNKTVFGGSHPSAMGLSPDGTLLYVTATNLDMLSVIDTATNQIVTEMDLNTFADGLQGLYPDAVAVSADGTRVYVADAGINAVQVIDVDPVHRTFTPHGFIPAGWYPSALALSADGSTLYVANAKGIGVGGNGGALVDISTETLGATPYYIGRLIKGTVSFIDLATVDLAAGTAAVRTNNGLDPIVLNPVDDARDNPVPLDFGTAPSGQINYVVYILKENRTYDQVLGDLDRGNGDPRLTLFGERVTPNAHALARQFAIGDNFFDDAEVSYPGHEWVTQGNNNDFVEKIWPFEYNAMLGTPYNVESGQEGFCKGGYIFEALNRQHVPYRVYGEPLAFNARFAAGINGGGVNSTIKILVDAFGGLPALVAHIDDLLTGDLDALRAAGVDVDTLTNVMWPQLMLAYPSSILPNKTDVYRAQLFQAELAQFVADNNLPNFLFIWLPNDHTFGASPNTPTPDAAVADNDTGLGMIIESLSQSPFWPQMAIFVTEDDAQDGQDHVSAHRTLSLVVSPYVKHGYVSAVHSSNVGMLKTMELLLGVQPMSQYDRYATDMRDYFTTTPDLTPFTAAAATMRPAVNPSADAAPNALLREAAAVSATLDFDEYDAAGPELSRVLWLVHVGERIERQRRAAAIAATLLPVLLIGGGMVMQWRRRAVPSA
jgi:YVTN family beta-propeller protein